MKRSDQLSTISDGDLCDAIREIRGALDRLPSGSCLGRRIAASMLARYEDEMVRRYEVEMWGTAR